MSKKIKEQKVENLVEKSREVFKDCFLPNNCLVAAPCHMPYYPARSKSYFYCWAGRDLGYNVTGALHLEIDVFKEVLEWIWERAEGYRGNADNLGEGIILRSHHPNGRVREKGFQPDQTGTLLWAACEYQEKRGSFPLLKKVIKKSTKGLLNTWEKNHFSRVTEDLWEERITHPKFNNNFTYTLAACSKGLEKAGQVLSDKKAQKASKEMKNLLSEAYDDKRKYFLRRFGGEVEGDKNVDASLLALAWPFEVIDPKDKRMINTIEAIEKNIVDKRGVYRYQFDEYEGETESGDLHYKQGAGAWPLLTFWMSIVQNKAGNKKKAEKYFWKVIDRMGEDLLIPEQLFPEADSRVGVKPLLWSHMMFVHAAAELGYLKK